MANSLDIITVVLNDKAGLLKTANSVARHLCFQIRWIVIDGNSIDGTKSILEEYEDDHITILSEADEGIYDAMNKGLALSRSDYVLFLNAGDALCSLLELRKLIEGLGSCISVYEVRLIDKYGNQLRKVPLKTSVSALEKLPSIPHQTAIIPRNLFNKNGIYDVSYRFLADYEKFCCFYNSGACFEFNPNVILTEFNNDGVSSNFRYYRLIYKEISKIQRQYFNRVSKRMILVYNMKYFMYRLFNIQTLNKIRKW